MAKTGEGLLLDELTAPTGEEMLAALYFAAPKGRGYYWDKEKAAYISRASGKAATLKQVQSHLDRYGTRFTERNLQKLTDDLLKNKITIATWQQRVAAEIKNAWIINLSIGRGGYVNLAIPDFGRAGGRLRGIYQRLNLFALDIQGGKLTEAQIRARINLYSTNTMTALWDGVTAAKQAAGFDQERRVLSPAEHCSDCVGYSEMGWVAINSLPPPGQGSVCNGNCRCLKEYRKSIEAVTQ